jgi:hypothetical protein
MSWGLQCLQRSVLNGINFFIRSETGTFFRKQLVINFVFKFI